MVKKVGLLLIIIAVIVVLNWEISNDNYEDNDDSTKKETLSDPALEDRSRDNNPESLVNEVFLLSEEGKVLKSPFIAGETNIEEVNNKWGKPEEKTEEEKGIYESFPKYDVTVGHKDNLVVDLRSYKPRLQNINMDDIKNSKGEPDGIRFYKDNDQDQVFLTYTVNAEYQLNWVLSKDEDEFKVDHVSVYAYWTEQNKNKRAALNIMKNMDIDEKIGQMIVAGLPGLMLDINTKSLINKQKIGGIILYENNLETPEQSIDLINQLETENKDRKSVV